VQETSPFLDVVRQRHPPLDALLLALAAHFRPVDQWHARERLDDFSRHLFGEVGVRVLSRLCRAYTARARGREAVRAATLLRAIAPCPDP
jgi:hypothetical protein